MAKSDLQHSISNQQVFSHVSDIIWTRVPAKEPNLNGHAGIHADEIFFGYLNYSIAFTSTLPFKCPRFLLRTGRCILFEYFLKPSRRPEFLLHHQSPVARSTKHLGGPAISYTKICLVYPKKENRVRNNVIAMLNCASAHLLLSFVRLYVSVFGYMEDDILFNNRRITTAVLIVQKKMSRRERSPSPDVLSVQL